MIYELRTYDLRPHAVAEAEKRFGKAYAARKPISAIAASFHTEIGRLNQIIQIWPYRDLAERERLSAAAAQAGAWPPAIDDLLVGERCEIFVPFPFAAPIEPGRVGPYFELRRYTYADGDLPKIVQAWEAALPERLACGPLVTVCSCEAGGVNQLLHIWPYESLDERGRLRERIRATGHWPPHVLAAKLGLPPYRLLRQENQILVASAFSPLQ